MICLYRYGAADPARNYWSHRISPRWCWAFVIGSLIVSAAGCALLQGPAVLPSAASASRGPLVFHSDHPLNSDAAVFDELNALCRDISTGLDLPVGSRSVDVFLFSDPHEYRRYVRQYFPAYGDRRALFVNDQGMLQVLAPVTDELEVDLRHEIAHSCLHSAAPAMPLWLDEGIAEYYEVPPPRRSDRRDHVATLLEARRTADWHPDLKRLESIEQPSEMGPLEYAEAWLWAHYFLEGSDANRRVLQAYLARVRQAVQTPHLSSFAPLPPSEWNDRVERHFEQITGRR